MRDQAAIGRIVSALAACQAILAAWTADHKGGISGRDALLAIQQVLDESDFVALLDRVQPGFIDRIGRLAPHVREKLTRGAGQGVRPTLRVVD